MIPEEVLRTALSVITGESQVLASDIAWELRSPCADCPFMKSSPFHQGVASHIPGYVESIRNNEFAHTCHKTDHRLSVDGPLRGKPNGRPVQHCAGATLMLLKTGRGFDLQLPLLEALECGKLTSEQLQEMTARAKADPNVFTVPQLLRFYEDGVRDLLKSWEPADV